MRKLILLCLLFSGCATAQAIGNYLNGLFTTTSSTTTTTLIPHGTQG